MIIAYLQGGPADLQKHVLDYEKPPKVLLIAHMDPVPMLCTTGGEALAPTKKLRYAAIGGWAGNVTYAYEGEVQEIVTK